MNTTVEGSTPSIPPGGDSLGEDFSSFLGFTRCPLELLSLKPDELTRTLYLPWTHQLPYIPRLVEKILNFVAEHSEASSLVIAQESSVLEASKKRSVEALADEALNRLEELPRYGPLCDTLRIYSTEFELLHDFQKARLGRPLPLTVKYRLLDMETPEEISKGEADYEYLRAAEGAIYGFLNLSVEEVRSIEGIDTKGTIAATYHELVSEYIDALAQLVSPYRNALMERQVRAIRAENPNAIVIVLTGSAHSSIGFNGRSREGTAMQFAGLPDEFLTLVPEGVTLQSYFKQEEGLGAALAEGYIPLPEEKVKASFALALSKALGADVLSLSSLFDAPMKHDSLIADFLLRTLVSMTSEEEITRFFTHLEYSIHQQAASHSSVHEELRKVTQEFLGGVFPEACDKESGIIDLGKVGQMVFYTNLAIATHPDF